VGLKEVREVVADGSNRLRVYGRRTLLFLDEIHRFNKAQQDALLPHVEAGTVILVGATTENPSFEVNSALLSRCKVVRLERLADDEIVAILRRAIADPERGLGASPLAIDDAALASIARHADGDARRALTTLEVAASLGRRSGDRAPERSEQGEGGGMGPASLIDEATVGEALQQKTLAYDRAGEEHYNVVSAFIKSLRGSDPDAAIYWMARMLEAGEEPLFVCRRMVIFAAEDVGLADPRALGVANAATDALRFVGLPEGVLPMTMAALYLARAPKSNTALTTWTAARKAVEEKGALGVPLHLRNAPTPMMKAMGYGGGYQYPHDFEGHRVDAEYLPAELREKRFYAPSGQGDEKK
ncbi:MAG: replication-associated recombination protein A, partial [Myxococcota bacterium]